MAFVKAEPEQAKLSIAMFGKPGSGKTFSALLIAEGLAKLSGKRIAFIDTEHSGTDWYSQHIPSRQVHPERFDFDRLRTRSIAECNAEFAKLDPKEYGVIVVDSITHLWESAKEAYRGRKTAQGGIPMHAWGPIKRPYKGFIDAMLNSTMHVIICGREKSVFEEVDGELKKTGEAMKAEGETEYEPSVTLHLEAIRRHSGKGSSTDYMAWVEKDRSGILSGRTLKNISYKDFEPLVEVLSKKHHVLQDEEERLALDGAAIEEEVAKAEKRKQRSEDKCMAFITDIYAAGTTDTLDEIGAAIKKARRYLVDEDLAELKKNWRDKYNAIQAGSDGILGLS